MQCAVTWCNIFKNYRWLHDTENTKHKIANGYFLTTHTSPLGLRKRLFCTLVYVCTFICVILCIRYYAVVSKLIYWNYNLHWEIISQWHKHNRRYCFKSWYYQRRKRVSLLIFQFRKFSLYTMKVEKCTKKRTSIKYYGYSDKFHYSRSTKYHTYTLLFSEATRGTSC